MKLSFDDFSHVSRRGEVKIAKVYSGRIHQAIFIKPQPKQGEKGGKEFHKAR